MPRPDSAPSWRSRAAALAALLCLAGGAEAAEGGLYIAGDGFSFQTAAQRAMAQNPGGRRFFLLTLPPEAAALAIARHPGAAPAARARGRGQRRAAGVPARPGQRPHGRQPGAEGVVPVRGWPPSGSTSLPAGQRYFDGENPAQLPAANEALRRLRSACS